MADGIIKLIEYLAESSLVRGAFIAYAVLAVIAISMVIAIFAITIRQIFKHNRNLH